jgi:hypothetical protein
MQAWILLNTWTYDGLDILGVFSSEKAAQEAQSEYLLPTRLNSEIRGPFNVIQ